MIVVRAETRQILIGHQIRVELHDDRALVPIDFQSKTVGEMQIETKLILPANDQTRRITRRVLNLRADDFQRFPVDGHGQSLPSRREK